MATIMETGDGNTPDRLFRSKLRVVVNSANRYEGCGLPLYLEELINTRSISLIQAIRNFNSMRGSILITYFVRWLRKCIIRYIVILRGTVRIPTKKAALMHKILATYRSLPQEFGQEISTEKLAENQQLILSDIDNIQQAKRTYYSVDASISEYNKTSYLEFLEVREPASTAENLFHHIRHDKIVKLLRNLDPQEQETIRLKYGLDANPMTLEKKKFALSRENIQKFKKPLRYKAHANNRIFLNIRDKKCRE